MKQLFRNGFVTNLKRLIKKLPLAITRNQQYDIQTKQIIQKVCTPHSNTIDVGAHEGSILDLLIQQSPNGHHFGFEPIPVLFQALEAKYTTNQQVHLFELAIADTKAATSFNYVLSNPSYSGIKKRKYDRANETDTLIHVQTDLLDDLIMPYNLPIRFIKIDVEGGEMAVLKGATNLIKRDQPVIVFECGLGGTDIYNTTPAQLFHFFEDLQYSIALMKDFLQAKPALDQAAFEAQYYQQQNYYFVAYPTA